MVEGHMMQGIIRDDEWLIVDVDERQRSLSGEVL